jgi:ribosomal protein S18 acetylase RimI-like enzyme
VNWRGPLDARESTYIIRPALVNDGPGIARVHVESWKTTYAGIFPEAVLTALSVEKRAHFWRGSLAAPEPGSITLVACDPTGSVVGFVAGGNERTGQLGRDGELYSIYLLQATQRQGVGTLLVRYFVRELRLREFTSMVVWVLDVNPSRKFYEALGGQVISQQYIERGGQSYLEVAFGWDDLSTLSRAER